MISGFLTNAIGALVPTLLACGITYLLLMTMSERSLANSVLFFAFLFIWIGSTVIGYIVIANNTVYIVFALAVLGTLLLLVGKKKPSETDAKDQETGKSRVSVLMSMVRAAWAEGSGQTGIVGSCSLSGSRHRSDG